MRMKNSPPHGDEDDEQTSALLQIPPGAKNYITRHGYVAMKNELLQLIDVARPEVVKIVSWAASNGDRSENGDYIYGKRRLREIDRRIRFLQKRVDRAELFFTFGDRLINAHFVPHVETRHENIGNLF